MKKFFLLIAISFISIYSFAQNDGTKHEIYFGAGVSPISIPSPNLPSQTDGAAGNTRYSSRDEKPSGTINIGYAYHLSNYFAIGLNYSYGTVKRGIHIGSSNKLAEMKNDIHTFMLTTKYEWLHTEKFSFYSRAAAGILNLNNGKFSDVNDHERPFLNSDKIEDKKGFAWQVSPIGVDWDFVKNAALFVEGGIGNCGFALAGIKLKF